MKSLIAAWLVVLPSLAMAQGSTPAAPSPAPPASPAAQAPSTAPAAATALPAVTKVVYMEPERVFDESAEGKRLSASLDAFRQKKVAPLAERNKQLEALRAKRQDAATATAASIAALDREISRLALELERGSQDAEREYNEQAGQAQAEFQRKLQPILQQLLKESGAHVLLTPAAGISWVDPSVDISAELVKRLDGAYPGGAPAKR